MKKRKNINNSPSRLLKGSDIILNLQQIQIGPQEAYSSETCSHSAYFVFKDKVPHESVDDPDMTGTIDVLDVQKAEDGYVLKIKFKSGREGI